MYIQKEKLYAMDDVTMEHTETIELQRLTQLETEIGEGLKTFMKVGSALLEIRDTRLYRLNYGTFEEYCQERWGMSRSYAHRTIEAAQTVGNLLPIGNILPATESQVRPLTQLAPEDQAIVWQRATETATNGRVTAAHVQSVKDEYEKAKRITEPSDYDFSDDATDYDWTEDEESPEQAYIEPEEVAIVSKPHVSNNSGNNEWYTPSEYVEAARKVLGVIELDPASSPEANQVVKAKVYYTVNDDGLQFDWHGKVWMNPPYASGLIDRFATKIVFHYENKDITEAIILVNNATETGWFNEIINASSAAIFPKSRVRFWKPDGELGAPLQGQAIMYLGANKESFLREFSKFGWGAEIVIPR